MFSFLFCECFPLLLVNGFFYRVGAFGCSGPCRLGCCIFGQTDRRSSRCGVRAIFSQKKNGSRHLCASVCARASLLALAFVFSRGASCALVAPPPPPACSSCSPLWPVPVAWLVGLPPSGGEIGLSFPRLPVWCVPVCCPFASPRRLSAVFARVVARAWAGPSPRFPSPGPVPSAARHACLRRPVVWCPAAVCLWRPASWPLAGCPSAVFAAACPASPLARVVARAWVGPSPRFPSPGPVPCAARLCRYAVRCPAALPPAGCSPAAPAAACRAPLARVPRRPPPSALLPRRPLLLPPWRPALRLGPVPGMPPASDSGCCRCGWVAVPGRVPVPLGPASCPVRWLCRCSPLLLVPCRVCRCLVVRVPALSRWCCPAVAPPWRGRAEPWSGAPPPSPPNRHHNSR